MNFVLDKACPEQVLLNFARFLNINCSCVTCCFLLCAPFPHRTMHASRDQRDKIRVNEMLRIDSVLGKAKPQGNSALCIFPPHLDPTILLKM